MYRNTRHENEQLRQRGYCRETQGRQFVFRSNTCPGPTLRKGSGFDARYPLPALSVAEIVILQGALCARKRQSPSVLTLCKESI